MLPTRTPGSPLDRLLMAAFTFLAVGCCVLGVRAHGEPFAWALLAGVLPLLYWNAIRARGLAAWAALPLFLFVAFDGSVIAQGTFAGICVGGLARCGFFFAAFYHDGHGNPNRLPLSVGQQLILIGLSMLAWVELGTPDWLPWLALGLFLGLWVWCYRQMFELACEPPLRLMYRIRWTGPGSRQFPPRGPVLVLANHGCWFDPMYMGKILTRPMTPMMTSRFYDIWFIRPLLKYIFRVVVVPDVERRKDAPELADAAACLTRGECVMIFPEGYLRRTEDKPLRRFGRGAWQILTDCPDVPVVACWIEGGWGSWCSYRDGPPTKNKPKDWGRPIAVGMAAPVTIPAEVLADQMRTRFHLMNLVSGARVHIGLEPLPPFEIPAGANGSDEG